MKKFFMVVTILMILSLPTKVQASNNYWTQDNIDADISQDGSDTIISLSTKDMEKDYGYLVVKGQIKNMEEELKGLSFAYELKTNTPFFVAIFLEDKNNNKLLLKEDAAFGQITEEEIALYSFEEKQYQIKNSGRGQLCLPYSAFEENANFVWEEANTYAIEFVIPKNASISLKLNGMKETIIEQSVFETRNIPKLIGPSSLEMPVHGESIARYEVTNKDFSISLAQEAKGIRLENDLLIVSKTAEEGSVTLKLTNGKGVSVYKEIEVMEPLRGNADYLPKFPAPEEIETIFIPLQMEISATTLLWVRVIAGGIVCVLVIVYALCYRKAIKEMKEEI